MSVITSARPPMGSMQAPKTAALMGRVPMRGLDPATSDKEYSQEQTRYLQAVMAYRERTGRKFISPVECFNILAEMGYALNGIMA